jgi:hypothetical protein
MQRFSNSSPNACAPVGTNVILLRERARALPAVCGFALISLDFFTAVVGWRDGEESTPPGRARSAKAELSPTSTRLPGLAPEANPWPLPTPGATRCVSRRLRIGMGEARSAQYSQPLAMIHASPTPSRYASSNTLDLRYRQGRHSATSNADLARFL